MFPLVNQLGTNTLSKLEPYPFMQTNLDLVTSNLACYQVSFSNVLSCINVFVREICPTTNDLRAINSVFNMTWLSQEVMRAESLFFIVMFLDGVLKVGLTFKEIFSKLKFPPALLKKIPSFICLVFKTETKWILKSQILFP